VISPVAPVAQDPLAPVAVTTQADPTGRNFAKHLPEALQVRVLVA